MFNKFRVRIDRFRMIVAGAVTASVALIYLRGYRPDESTGEWAFDLQWLSDLNDEAIGTIVGLLIASGVIWILPIDWNHVFDMKLPVAVRTAILWALVALTLGITLSVSGLF